MPIAVVARIDVRLGDVCECVAHSLRAPRRLDRGILVLRLDGGVSASGFVSSSGALARHVMA